MANVNFSTLPKLEKPVARVNIDAYWSTKTSKGQFFVTGAPPKKDNTNAQREAAFLASQDALEVMRVTYSLTKR